MPDEPDSWLETLGVTGFNSDTSAADFADESSNEASDSAAEFLEADQAAETDIIGGPGDSTLVMNNPIGALQLLSSSQVDSAGLIFNVTVVSSTKDPLIFLAVATGQPVGTVKILQAGSAITLQNVSITSANSFSSGSVGMTLQSDPPGKKPRGPTSSTLIMDNPIGVLQLLSSQPNSAGTVFDVTVASSTKDPLLFLASATGQSFATVKISQPSGVFTLQNVLISSLRSSGPGSNLDMTLNSARPATFSPE